MTEKPQRWINRIVGSASASVEALLANPFNFRIHPLAQREALEGSLDSVGWIQQVVVNKNTGHIIDGHLRIQLALSHQEDEVPVLYVELSPEEEQLALMMLDPVAAMAVTDREKLEELMHSVKSDNDNVRQFMEDLAAREALAGFGDFEGVDFEDFGAAENRDVRYRVVIECDSLEEAEEIADGIDAARVEQFKV